jgi:hypothetical protein
MDPTVIAAVVSAYPKIAPYLAALPVLQMVAGLVANIPRVFGVTHSTIWERVWMAIATAHVVPSPNISNTSVAALFKGRNGNGI